MVRSKSVGSSSLANVVSQDLAPVLPMVVAAVGIANIESLQLAAWSDSAMLLAQLR